jgi:3-hydroxyacyl-CoA dehydrogenase
MLPVYIENEEGIAFVTIDNPPVNVFSHAVRQALHDTLAGLAQNSAVRALVLIGSGKSFVSGADLAEFGETIQAPLHRDVLESLESLEKPCIAVLHGTVLGAGVEIAAACHYRIAAPGTSLGMPEVTLGIVPGAGGTQRLPRLMGLGNAAALLLSGRPIFAEEALAQGLIDEIAGSDIREAALAAAERLVGSSPSRTRDRQVVDASAAVLDAAMEASSRQFPRRTAPRLISEALRASAESSFDEGMKAEAALSDRSLTSPESRALRHLFFAERETFRIPGIDTTVTARPVTQVAIIGSGTMGGGIAMAFVDAGLPVTLLDISEQALEKGVERVKANYASSVKRGRLTEEQVAQRLALLEKTTNFAGIRSADLVIEAAPEKMSLKKEIFRKLDAVMKSGAILATNTSTLDINLIAAETTRPADVIGLHFFSPANVMRLLEVVRADKTADHVLVTAFAVARRLKKVGVLSRVCYGFIGNRMMDPYQREAEKMLLEGATPWEVDSALEEFGMAMGILAVHDMAGIDVGEFTRREREIKRPGAEKEFRGSALLFEKGWLGQKNGRGFYIYSGRARQPNLEAEAMFRREASKLNIAPRSHSGDEIQQRCLLALVNEGAKILEEGIALRASDIDVVYTAGYGFPRDRGGPMFWADSVGVKHVLDGILDLEAKFGSDLWTPAPLLRRLAEEGQKFSE